jgi:exodeoxyribonuclease V
VDKGADEKTGKRILYFQRVHSVGAMRGKVVLLDECSMIDAKTANDLLQSGAKIVAVGDPGQLPPVHGATFFNQPDITLTQIHRQALESPIIRQAHAVRENGGYQTDGADFQVVRKASDEQMMTADAILCWRNVTRHKVNSRMRSLLGYSLPYPQAGEPVLCLKNALRYGIFNGVTYELARNFLPDDDAIYLLMDGVEVEVPKCVFVEKGGSLDDYDDDDFTSAFDFGYCLTVHKSQGSEWNKVLLIDENHKHERRRWLYTGLTRAAKSIVVQV